MHPVFLDHLPVHHPLSHPPQQTFLSARWTSKVCSSSLNPPPPLSLSLSFEPWNQKAQRHSSSSHHVYEGAVPCMWWPDESVRCLGSNTQFPVKGSGAEEFSLEHLPPFWILPVEGQTQVKGTCDCQVKSVQRGDSSPLCQIAGNLRADTVCNNAGCVIDTYYRANVTATNAKIYIYIYIPNLGVYVVKLLNLN